MKLIRTQQCWYGRLNPGFSDEKESIKILGTDLIPLPFTGRATKETVREYYRTEKPNCIIEL